MINSANRGSEQIIFGNDSIVIKKHISDIEGGRTLNVETYPLNNIPAGSVIVKKDDVYSPMPIKKDGTNEDGTDKYIYDALPSGAVYVGILYRTVAKNDPQASIMFDGVVNEECVPFPIAAIKTAFLASVPRIVFIKDEEA